MTWKKLVLQKILLQQTELTVCFLPRNASEPNSESLLLFLFHGTEFLAFFSSAELFGTEFREFSVLRNSRNSAGTNQLFVYSVFRGIIFLSEIANPSYDSFPGLTMNSLTSCSEKPVCWDPACSLCYDPLEQYHAPCPALLSVQSCSGLPPACTPVMCWPKVQNTIAKFIVPDWGYWQL